MKTDKLVIPVQGLIHQGHKGRLIPLFVCLVLSSGLLSGCMSSASESDPYDGLSCEAKIDKMTRELLAFEASKKPLAKASDEDTIPPDTTTKTPLDTTRIIQLFRGFPPVAGMTGTDTTHTDVPQIDSTTTFGNGNKGIGVVWIPPVGFSDSDKTIHPNPLPDSTAPVRDTSAPKPLPSDITVVQVICTGKYNAHVRILDYKKDLVREFDQEFGYLGELQNPSRVVPMGLVSFLVWDNMTTANKRAGDGVYLWDVRITLATGQVQNMSAKTGLLGDECKTEP